MVGAERGCFHCGEPVDRDCNLFVTFSGRKHPVCCRGCQAVFQLISDAGLDRFYHLRQALGRKITDDISARRQAWQAIDDRQSMWGSPVESGQRELLLQVEGIRCAACAWLIRRQLESSPGVASVQLDLASGFTRILWNPSRTRLSRIATSLFELGYVPHLPLAAIEEQGRRRERRDSLKRLGVSGLGMMQVMMYAVGLYAGDAFGMSPAARGFLTWVSLLVTLPVVMYAGRVFFTGAWAGIKSRRPGMDVPVALAIGLAFTASCINFFRGQGDVWFDSVVMFIFFLTLGRHVELLMRHRNLQAGTALARLMPEWARRITVTGEQTIPAADLATGDRVRVAPGETFPADGLIVSGDTEVDEGLLTGESRVISRTSGEPVVAGTVNLLQAVDVDVTAAGNDSTLSALARLVLAAQTRRSGTAGLPSWLVPAFVITVITFAGATWFYWHLVSPELAFPAALAVLVASCPCALSLAIPAVNSAASHRLMQAGVLLTRGEALHDLLSVDTLIFDKTGTLTCGRPEIQSTKLNLNRQMYGEHDLLQVAAALESHSIHPVARAFRCAAGRLSASKVVAHASGGLAGLVNGRRWCIGSAGFVGKFLGRDVQSAEKGDIWLADEHDWCARFSLRDTLRPGSQQVIRQLSSSGLDLSILSGDEHAAVALVAERLGVPSWVARQRPEEKLRHIRALQARGKTVLMVGDGANDGPVLAAADVSMTVQGATELANSTADLILTSESLLPVLSVFEIGRKAARLVRQNLTWALCYNAAVMPLAVSGALQPWMAALGMSASSLVVVLNAARLSGPAVRSRPASAVALEMQPQ